MSSVSQRKEALTQPFLPSLFVSEQLPRGERSFRLSLSQIEIIITRLAPAIKRGERVDFSPDPPEKIKAVFAGIQLHDLAAVAIPLGREPQRKWDERNIGRYFPTLHPFRREELADLFNSTASLSPENSREFPRERILAVWQHLRQKYHFEDGSHYSASDLKRLWLDPKIKAEIENSLSSWEADFHQPPEHSWFYPPEETVWVETEVVLYYPVGYYPSRTLQVFTRYDTLTSPRDPVSRRPVAVLDLKRTLPDPQESSSWVQAFLMATGARVINCYSPLSCPPPFPGKPLIYSRDEFDEAKFRKDLPEARVFYYSPDSTTQRFITEAIGFQGLRGTPGPLQELAEILFTHPEEIKEAVRRYQETRGYISPRPLWRTPPPSLSPSRVSDRQLPLFDN